MKLWDKGIPTNHKIEMFTVGSDREIDLLLAPWDVIGNMAHVIMLKHIGLITETETRDILNALQTIYQDVQSGNFSIDESMEDVHSQVEFLVTKMIGESGKKIHSARSRNDQVLLDIRLFARHAIYMVLESTNQLFDQLIHQSETYKDVLIPGFTHMQAAMPSSFGLWFGAYAESLADDIQMLGAAYKLTNQNPLGSAAGYGSSFPIDRDLTTQLLGFEDLNYNSVYAQMGRGKTERNVTMALSSIAFTLSKMANDVCLFASQNFGFLSLPDEFTTGSSIMPHKKNPDVFELIRAKCNKIQAFLFEIITVTNNLSSGYFRDYQVVKEGFLNIFGELNSCLEMATLGLGEIKVNKNIIDDSKYRFIFSVEYVNREVLNGIPFRDAYRKVASEIENGTFRSDMKINHSHIGSIGNLCNDKIRDKFEKARKEIRYDKAEKALKDLINY